jgi:carbamoyltransferase
LNILGISCFYHDAAACLVKDGAIVAAAQEERFTRIKHDPNFPSHAIGYVLSEGKITYEDLDFIAFYDKPWIKFERILETYLAFAPRGILSFLMSMPVWIKDKIRMDKLILAHIKDSGKTFKGELLFPEHHISHAASAFYPSPFKEAAILIIDGVGEWASASYGIGKENEIDLHKEIRFPHSLGLLYSAFTYYTGFKVNSGEYKVMGLAPFGQPNYVDLIYKYLITVKEDGSFKMNMDYFDYCVGLTMTNKKFNDLFGGPPRKPESPLTQKEMDLAASVQKVTQEIMLKMARHIRKETGMTNLCLAGGVALNCVANGLILKEKIFENIWIQPASGDSGGALGAALYVWHSYLGNSRVAQKKDSMQGSYLGNSYSTVETASFIEKKALLATFYEDDVLPGIVAKLLSGEKVIGLFNGRMEFGARALGGRSIIGDPRSAKMQSVMNLKIKFRESFRPFAPSVLKEKANEWFDLNTESPYMLLVAPLNSEKLIEISNEEQQKQGIEKLNSARSEIPAITHVDNSARIQTVDKESNPFYYALIQEFEKLTCCPVIINTSFNVRGEPIVCSLEDAYQCFMRTDMDYLVLGNYILDKSNQEKNKISDTSWKKKFELD